MRAPVVTKPGLATYNKTFGAGINRWGDFSHSAVDPQDDEALWTVQEFAAAHQSGASRWSTWWAQAIPATTDLQVAIRDVDPVTAQSPESYDILVTNRGPLGATGVTATVTLPAALLDPINVPAGCAGTAPMICTIGALGANTTAHILLDVTRAAGPGTMSLHVSATATETDRTASDNVATATTTVRAEAGTQYVAVRDSGWTPQVLTVPKGGKVRWNVFGPSDHSAADATPMGLFDTGAITPVHSSAQVTFNAAGTYPVADATGGLPQSRISVLVGSAPLSGTRATNFTIRWAAAAPAAGYVFDVQHRAPGSTLWVPWKTGVTSPSTLWNPTSSTKLGTHGFRARLRKTGVADGFSGWSLGRFVQLHS